MKDASVLSAGRFRLRESYLDGIEGGTGIGIVDWRERGTALQ